MQEKESIMVVVCELKIPSLGITVTKFLICTSQPLKVLTVWVLDDNYGLIFHISSLESPQQMAASPIPQLNVR